ncbi:MAG TPA: type IV pilus modification protein PilV [Xanthomonadales bacterium]|nr:type IV pilus modification protein PilV [Xanthomonadales bacterium]
MKRNIKFQEGISLIEVMIALVVLSIGLVGMAAMQLNTLQFVHSAHYRSMATTVALDLEERLWLEIADSDLEECPDVSNDAGSPVAELLTHWGRDNVGGTGVGDWGWSDARMLKVPNLTLTAGTPTTYTRVVEVPITLTWNESRFEQEFTPGETTATESFEYNIRILCRFTDEDEEEEV